MQMQVAVNSVDHEAIAVWSRQAPAGIGVPSGGVGGHRARTVLGVKRCLRCPDRRQDAHRRRHLDGHRGGGGGGSVRDGVGEAVDAGEVVVGRVGDKVLAGAGAGLDDRRALGGAVLFRPHPAHAQAGVL